MDRIAAEFQKEANVRVVVSYSSTAQLAQQIEHGGPFDVFAAADTEHVDVLIEKGKLRPESRAIYARGQLALWVPDTDSSVRGIEDLTHPDVKFIAVAQPQLAPYGRAAVEALTAAGIWEQVRPKIAYASSISMAKQYASSGNANAAFTAFSLVLNERGAIVKIDPRLYKPIDQAVAIVASTRNQKDAKRFVAFLLGASGRAVFANNGYISQR
jgi:molybdate transport system substrate-binding protein